MAPARDNSPVAISAQCKTYRESSEIEIWTPMPQDLKRLSVDSSIF